MNGGLLVQDCTGHGIFGTHQIYEYETDKMYDITSTHHQMQYPFNLDSKDYSILFSSLDMRSKYYAGDNIDREKIIVEPEVVLYKKKNYPKCLAIQGHPEMMRYESPIIGRFNEIIEELLND